VQAIENHLSPEDFYQFVERTLPRARQRQMEEHLDLCPDCVGALGRVLSADRPGTASEEAALVRLGGSSASTPPTPQAAFDRLRASIAASAPGPASRTRSRVAEGGVLALAAGLIGLVVAGYLSNLYWIAPARSRALAEQALEDLIRVQQGTGKVPLRYLAGFERARVTRSGFETADPEGGAIERRLRRAVALAPGEPTARLALGLFLIDQARPAEAEAELRKAREIDPASVDAANGLAVALYLRGQASGDEALLRRGLDLLLGAQQRNYRDRQVAFNLGVVYEELGEKALAARAYRNYLRQDPSSEWGEVARERVLALELEHR